MVRLRILSNVILVGVLVSCAGGTTIQNRPVTGETLIRTEGPYQLWNILYWSRDKNRQSVQTTAKVYRFTDTSIRRPAVIFNHGGFTPCTLPQKMRPFVEMGYIVIGPDYQGCRGLGELDFLGTEIDDVLGALNWLKSKPFVDPTRIYMVGHSKGGSITLRILDVLPDLGKAREIKAAVVQSPNYSADLSIRAARSKSARHIQAIRILMMSYNLRSQGEAVALYRSRHADQRQNHDRIVTPIFIAHGTADTWASPKNSELLATDLSRIRVKNVLRFYPGAGHNFEGPLLTQFLRDIQIWFRENSR